MEALNIAGETGGTPWTFPLLTKVETLNSLLRKSSIYILPCSLPGPGFLVLHQFPTNLFLHTVTSIASVQEVHAYPLLQVHKKAKSYLLRLYINAQEQSQVSIRNSKQ